jgi:sarcosine oxidase subunit delta
MPRLHCPFCGPRALSEFRFRKSVPGSWPAASPATSPDAGPSSPSGAFERTYLRSEDPHDTTEDWQHLEGCRAWLRVRRDPSGTTVSEVRLLAGETP